MTCSRRRHRDSGRLLYGPRKSRSKSMEQASEEENNSQNRKALRRKIFVSLKRPLTIYRTETQPCMASPTVPIHFHLLLNQPQERPAPDRGSLFKLKREFKDARAVGVSSNCKTAVSS